MGVKLKLSTSFHPETDGTSKHMNKTVNQCIYFYIERNQTGWVKNLPLICFNLINTVNKSTTFSPFQLCMGHSPHILPPLVSNSSSKDLSEASAAKLIEKIHLNTLEAKDCLNCTKISQSVQCNKS
jgi:hypothetical protein